MTLESGVCGMYVVRRIALVESGMCTRTQIITNKTNSGAHLLARMTMRCLEKTLWKNFTFIKTDLKIFWKHASNRLFIS